MKMSKMIRKQGLDGQQVRFFVDALRVANVCQLLALERSVVDELSRRGER
jgi:hypothetical protein